MTLHGPFSCRKVVAWLIVMSLTALLLWWVGLLLLVLMSPSEVTPTAFAVMSYATLAGFSLFAYSVVLRHSAWFYALRPVRSWTASVLSAVVLAAGFLLLFSVVFTMYAGW